MKHWKSISATLLAASLVTTSTAWANETEKVDSTTFETVNLQDAVENVKEETATSEDLEVIASIVPVGYIANNITALSLNLEKISNPRAKEALQKNIERAIARWEAKNKVEEEPEVVTPEEDEVVVTPEEEVTPTPEAEVTPSPETEEEPVVVSEEDEDEEKTDAEKAAKKAETLAKAAEKKAAGLAKAEAKKVEAAAKKEAKKVEKEERKANKEAKHENKGKNDKE
ncbi:MAG: hypothetical protein ACE3JQ_07635 [Paenisporosarcina sp.]